uniref:protein FATTY ACID EXPORT 4, chloroplastic n=1 Tax=Erigeron canadensis TaxID=72917 RepID=UPI001CB8FF95|nr:protein FATTY ACID EXPORT 4, chloroplastic [Erigeron canadensis]XP_043606849.1 protein FATTY ACID EXPORT 4, chloroplastic [Erigeron canadensis]
MGSMIYTHPLPVFTSTRCPNVLTINNTAVTLLPTSSIQSNFVGSRHKLLSKFPTNSTSFGRRRIDVCKSQLQDYAPVASAGYALLLLGGGLFAYNKSGSKGSLFGGLTGATLMSVAYYLMQSPETKELGDALAFGASLLFVCIFGIRFAATRKLIPAGFLLGVSISITALTYSAYLQDKI